MMDIRNGDLNQITTLLRQQHARAVDITAPTPAITSVDGEIQIDSGEVELTMDGVTPIRSQLSVTEVADEGFSSRLRIPVAYLRDMRRRGQRELIDRNINGQMRYQEEQARAAGKKEPRMFLRTLKPVDGSPGILRAVLSNRYRTIDNLDVLLAALQGIREADTSVAVEACDLSDRRMYVRVVSEQVKAMAPDLLRGYQSPFDADPEIRRAGGWSIEQGRRAAAREGLGYEPGSEPVVFAGFVISNSEVAQGGFKITPRLVVQVCRNGLTIPVDALKERHIGGALDDGVVELSQRVVNAELELVTARAADAVHRYLTVDYVQRTLDGLAEAAGVRISRPDKVIRETARALRFDEATQDGILRHFMTAGQPTAGGVMNAVTSYAQTVGSADSAAALEDSALKALKMAAVAAGK